MARCPECGKIWHCLNPDDFHAHIADLTEEEYKNELYIHCEKCKCPDCRKEGDRMTIEEEYYGKRRI